MAEVEISYKGSSIATMNASGTKTLLTEGKYLEDDVEVTYTRPAAPSGTKNISITQNGQTTEDVMAYASAQITANVPNTYSAGDEGKVVSNGALVAQGSDTVTQNDTYDTTLISSLTVNVSGGGGLTYESKQVTIKNSRSSQINLNRLRIVNNNSLNLDVYNANVSAGSTNTDNYAAFLVNGSYHIVFHSNINTSSITCNGNAVAFISTNATTSNQKNYEVTLPAGFDNTYPIEIN